MSFMNFYLCPPHPLHCAISGSLVVSSLFPAPLIYQDIHDEGDAVKIICLAPRTYVDAWFDLLKEGQDQSLQSLAAAETQHQVTFVLERTSTRDGDQYRCRYRLYNGSQLQMSELSHILLIVLEGMCLSSVGWMKSVLTILAIIYRLQ